MVVRDLLWAGRRCGRTTRWNRVRMSIDVMPDEPLVVSYSRGASRLPREVSQNTSR